MTQDLYSELLGLPPGKRPLDHYAILGLEPFETFREKIHRALLDRTARLKSYALDPNPERAHAVQELLNQVSRAAGVLQAPKQKWAYDVSLAAERGANPPCPGCGLRLAPERLICPQCRMNLQTGEAVVAAKEPAPAEMDLGGVVETAFVEGLEQEKEAPPSPRFAPRIAAGPTRMTPTARPLPSRDPGRALEEVLRAEAAGEEEEATPARARRPVVRLIVRAMKTVLRRRVVEGAVALALFGTAIAIWVPRLARGLAVGRSVTEKAPGGATTVAPPAVVQPPAPTAPGPANVSEWQKQEAAKAGVPVTKEIHLGGGVTLKLLYIPPGEFDMGSPVREAGRSPNEGPVHRVRITKGFYMGVYEVTQAQWQAVMGNNPSSFKGANNPVDSVSWNDATEFCGKVSGRTAVKFRLPTEAEWEYACRAGTQTRFYGGDGDSDLSRIAWFNGNSGRQTHEVAQKAPNAWGLHDMHGNVWEWCEDWFQANYYAFSPSSDPQGPATGMDRVLRGRSWGDTPRLCRTALRDGSHPEIRGNNVGFRVVMDGAGGGDVAPRPVTPGPAPPVAPPAAVAAPAPTAPGPAKASEWHKQEAAKAGVPVTKEIDLGGGVTLKLLYIPPGEFDMGSPAGEQGRDTNEGPVHRVRITKGFYMGVYEVTQAQWQAVMGDNPSSRAGANNPVDSVTWNRATEFCNEVSGRTALKFRLPTEAEWEYACRAGSAARFSFGDDAGLLGDYAWDKTSSGGQTHPVGQKRPNAWGLYDMHGNVWEWCQSLYKEYPYREDDGRESLSAGGPRVLRGGSWGDNPRICRSAYRRGRQPELRRSSVGSRVVLE